MFFDGAEGCEVGRDGETEGAGRDDGGGRRGDEDVVRWEAGRQRVVLRGESAGADARNGERRDVRGFPCGNSRLLRSRASTRPGIARTPVARTVFFGSNVVRGGVTVTRARGRAMEK